MAWLMKYDFGSFTLYEELVIKTETREEAVEMRDRIMNAAYAWCRRHYTTGVKFKARLDPVQGAVVLQRIA